MGSKTASSNSLSALHISHTLTETNDYRISDSTLSPLRMNTQQLCTPQPNIMPRSNSAVASSNDSRNGKSGRISLLWNGGMSEIRRSDMSAFSSPHYTVFTDGSSPVPSIIASECSDGTLTCRTPIVNFSEYEMIVRGSEHLGTNGTSRMPIQINPRSQQDSSSMIGRTPFDNSYFTPIQSEPSDVNVTSSYQQQDHEYGFKTPLTIPEGYYPQCQEVPRAVSMSSMNAHCTKNYTRYPRNNVNTPLGFEEFDRRLYCMPVRSTEEPTFAQTQERPMKTPQLQVEAPMRIRKPSTDLSSDGSTGSKHHLPQNLKGDPQRQAKVKTEFCLNYAKNLPCPYWPNCNFAHGEHELKYKKLFELQKAGLVEDASSYRCHPCASWIATGAW